MRIHIKALTLCATTLTAAMIAGAHNPTGQERPNRKQAGFNCPVCESPCINKAALQQKLRQHRIQNQNGQPFQRNVATEAPNPRWQRDRQRSAQRPQRHEQGRFDIDGNGELSYAEKAARRAYRNAMSSKRNVQPNERPDPQLPAE